MRTRVVNWVWEDPDAQAAFAELVGFPNEQRSREEVEKIEALLQIRPPLRVLDVGCGTGRHALEMARRGYHVVGIDVARSYLESAQSEARRRGLSIEFRLQRGAELTEREVYDLALAYDHTLGFMSDTELAEHFGGIWASLKRDGRLLLALAGPKRIPGHVYERTRSWMEKGEKFILTEKYMEGGYRIERCIVIDRQKDEIIEYHERQRAFSLDDVRSLLRSAGFRRVVCLKDLEGDPATSREFRVFICHKT